MEFDATEYKLDIQHIKGKDNFVADCLSRIQWDAVQEVLTAKVFLLNSKLSF